MTKRFCLLVVLLVPAIGLAQITLPGCGNENESACSLGDSEYYANNPGRFSPCDFGLAQSGADVFGLGGTCVNGSAYSYQPRWTQSFNTSWTGWAMAQQRYGIGGDTPMNYITTIGTHNSFSNLDGGFSDSLAQDQILSITDQLQLGARYIRLDERYYEGQMRLCHGSNDLCSGLTSIISPGRLFANAVKEVANWLAQNPSEFIILDLNGDPQGNTNLVMSPILTYIGESKIVTTADANCLPPATTTCTFPSLNTVRNQGKQVLILTSSFQDIFTFSRDVLDEKDPFDPSTTNQTFASCLDTSSALMRDHSSGIWPYTSEDRSGSVLFVDPTKFLGFLDETEVQQATTCGYALIAFDFLNNRSHTYPEDSAEYSTVYPSLSTFPAEVTTDTPDNRFASSIWSFDNDDSGANLHAFMKTNGRWSTAVNTTSKNYACSDAPSNSFLANPNWHVTTGTGEFDSGESTCHSEGELLGQTWHFAHPVNGPQNLDLYNAANGKTPWVNYKVQAVPNFAVAPIAMGAVIQQGGSAPAGQQVFVGGPPNANVVMAAIPVGGRTDTSWLQLPDSPGFTLGSDGSATVNLGFTSAVSSLAPGFYQANVVFTIVGGGTVTSITTSAIQVGLTVKTTPKMILTCDGHAGLEDVAFPCSVVLSDPNSSASIFPANVTLKQIGTDSTGQTVTAGIEQEPVDVLTHIALFSPLMPVGNYNIVATYPGDAIYNAATSSTWNVAVLPFLAAAPLSETTSFPVGQPLSAQALQTIVYTNTSGATATVSCATSPCWMRGSPLPDPVNPKLNDEVLFLDSSVAATLAPGTYTGNVAIADGIHATLNVPITINVTTNFTVGSDVTLVAANARVASYLTVGVAKGNGISMLATSDQTWLTLTNVGGAPTNLGLVVDPTGLSPGNYVAHVTISSTLAPTVNRTVHLIVVPLTTITTNPPGLPIIVDSVNYVSPQTFVLDPQSPHTIGTAATAVLNANTQYTFQSWSDGKTLSHSINPPHASGETSTWTATFNISGYKVDISSSPANYGKVVVSPSPTNGFYTPGTSITATATPADNNVFSSFAGDLLGEPNPVKFNVNSPISATAIFTSGAQMTISAYTGAGQTTAVGEPFPLALSALVMNGGSPVSDMPVVFLFPASGASATLVSYTTVTNAAGIATAKVTANGVVGSFIAMATFGQLSAPFELTNTVNQCHVTTSGSIGVADVQSEINQALGAASPANDLTGDGAVNVVDVQTVMNAALQLGCTGS